ncbi:ABC-type antimicrobial peptide transport system permease subunit [Bacilli bacterium PM5-3]|nr:ABC-type antimicrobial peptide transport system permease subunit [Bacilli bacterium PM5-3]
MLDAFIKQDDQESTIRIITNDSISTPYIVQGKNISKNNECLVDELSSDLLNKTIKIKTNFKTKKCKVVGTVYSPSYFSLENKGYSSLKAEKIKVLVYTNKKFAKEFVKDIPFIKPYNSLSIILNDKPSNETYTDEYQDYVEKQEKSIKKLFDKNEINITSRHNNITVNNYYNDSSKIREIATIFPVIFFMVAALVGSSTMSRMIEDERLQIGTLSSIGYSRSAIITNYILYALLAVIFGIALGFLVGFTLIPTTVTSAYNIMYQLPEVNIYFDHQIALEASLISLITVVGSSFIVVFNQTKENCATLLRPKSPLAGKKVFLEKISFIWNKLSFINKVSLRNIFRFKKRLFMTILAIMGCSGLLMTGLGIRTSIFPIVDKQFKELQNYQITGYTNNLSDKVTKQKIKELKKTKNVSDVLALNSKDGTAFKNKIEYPVTLLTPQVEKDINKYLKFDSDFDDNSITITKQMADVFDLEKGSIFKMEINDKEYKFKITNVTTNYIGNYLYINKDEYLNKFKSLKYNCFYIKNTGANSEVVKDLEDNSMFIALEDASVYQGVVKDSLNGINQLVYIIIAFAGVLIIVVMYTLTNINLIERRRELATLKVLGFYDREVSSYVLKENVILTILGLMIGLGFGKYLHLYIITMIDIHDIYFIREQPLENYIIAFVITLIFSLSVNILMQPKIKKIDMVDSLKSIE